MTQKLNVKITVAERTLFEYVAEANGLNLSSWVRNICILACKKHMGNKWQDLNGKPKFSEEHKKITDKQEMKCNICGFMFEPKGKEKTCEDCKQ